jgi:predicted nucleic acid-binding protein
MLFDAGSLINLGHGQVLEALVSTADYQGHVGQIVLGECAKLVGTLHTLASLGRLLILPDLPLSAAQFAAKIREHNLGAGETECLLQATMGNFVVSCDDRRARYVLSQQIGPERVTGTIGLLIKAVATGLMPGDAAYGGYLMMRSKGGFLPVISSEDFRSLCQT